MSKIDARTHEYLKDNSRFADIVNYYVYDGEQIVNPSKLKELDPSEITFPHKKGRSSGIIQKSRDLLKNACVMQDEKVTYMIIGIENQAKVQYAMPVKNLLYDAEQYSKQVSATAKKHKKEERNNNISSGEFLSGFYKDDKLIPVITIVVFWSADKWDGPLTLHDMFEEDDPDIMKFIPDYKINLIEPYNIKDEDFEKLKTDLAGVLKYIKYSNEKESLQKILHSDMFYEEVDRETAELLNDVVGEYIKIEEGERKINMSNAFEDIKKETVECINKLNAALIRDNRLDDLKKSVEDKDYQEELLKEYDIYD